MRLRDASTRFRTDISPIEIAYDYSMERQHKYLVLYENRSEAVEELERGDDLTLHKYRRRDCSRTPPTCADGHLIEPLFERERSRSTTSSSKKVIHIHDVDVAKWPLWLALRFWYSAQRNVVRQEVLKWEPSLKICIHVRY